MISYVSKQCSLFALKTSYDKCLYILREAKKLELKVILSKQETYLNSVQNQ